MALSAIAARAARREGDTPLIDAARHGRADDVAALLADGADVNQADDEGFTPLMIACACIEDHTDEIITKLTTSRRRAPAPTEQSAEGKEWSARKRWGEPELLGGDGGRGRVAGADGRVVQRENRS